MLLFASLQLALVRSCDSACACRGMHVELVHSLNVPIVTVGVSALTSWASLVTDTCRHPRRPLARYVEASLTVKQFCMKKKLRVALCARAEARSAAATVAGTRKVELRSVPDCELAFCRRSRSGCRHAQPETSRRDVSLERRRRRRSAEWPVVAAARRPTAHGGFTPQASHRPRRRHAASRRSSAQGRY